MQHPHPQNPTKGHLMTATATPSTPMQSWMAWLLSNIHDQNSILWMLDALSWITTWNQSNEQDPTHTHPFDHANCKTYLLEPTQYHINNSLLATYATSPYNPAFDIHPKLPNHCQKCHQYNSFLTNYATSPYNPGLQHPPHNDQSLSEIPPAPHLSFIGHT